SVTEVAALIGPGGRFGCSSAGYAARRAPAGPLSAGMTTTAHAPRRGGPGSDELLVTRQPERDDDPPLPCRPVGVAVEDLPPGDPELLLSAATQQIQAFVAQHDAVHLDVSASHAPRAVATVFAHVRTLLSPPHDPKVAPRHLGRRRHGVTPEGHHGGPYRGRRMSPKTPDALRIRPGILACAAASALGPS